MAVLPEPDRVAEDKWYNRSSPDGEKERQKNEVKLVLSKIKFQVSYFPIPKAMQTLEELANTIQIISEFGEA